MSQITRITIDSKCDFKGDLYQSYDYTAIVGDRRVAAGNVLVTPARDMSYGVSELIRKQIVGADDLVASLDITPDRGYKLLYEEAWETMLREMMKHGLRENVMLFVTNPGQHTPGAKEFYLAHRFVVREDRTAEGNGWDMYLSVRQLTR
ncbi:MAG TPA: hypothetical protein VJH97_01370 [Candidatus Nanoarchaeia archaeon]|nr:hypothetical protein [Candidatus Nanoarchaeia archaeon]